MYPMRSQETEVPSLPSFKLWLNLNVSEWPGNIIIMQIILITFAIESKYLWL